MNFKKLPALLAILFPFQILFIAIISKHPAIVEKYYSQILYPTIAVSLRFLLGWLPFSFGDVLGFLLIILLGYAIYKIVKTKFKNIVSKLITFIAILSTLYFCFYCFWGLNYFRKSLANNLNISQKGYTTEQLIATTNEVVIELNRHHLAITKNDTIKVTNPYNTTQVYKKAPEGFKVLAKTYPQLNYQLPSIKSSLVSVIHMYTGTSGYFNPITGEAQVNKRIPKTGFPATTCHEMAHQIGWSAENDANFVGFLAATANTDVYFKYAGYRMAFNYLMRDIKKRDEELAKEIWKTVNKGVAKDFKASYILWSAYENPFEPYIKKTYSSYLKVNNQSKGIKSYSYVVDLLIAYHNQKGLDYHY